MYLYTVCTQCKHIPKHLKSVLASTILGPQQFSSQYDLKKTIKLRTESHIQIELQIQASHSFQVLMQIETQVNLGAMKLTGWNEIKQSDMDPQCQSSIPGADPKPG